MLTLSMRGARSTDQSYVANSWVSTLAGPREQWGARGHVVNAQVDKLLDDARTELLIACMPEDKDRILGWCATAKIPGARVVQFVHVRRARRREGIARLLLYSAQMLGRGSPVACLYETPEGEQMRKALLPSSIVMTPEEFIA